MFSAQLFLSSSVKFISLAIFEETLHNELIAKYSQKWRARGVTW